MAERRVSLLSAPRGAQGRGCRAPRSKAATGARKRGHNRHFLAVKRCFLQDLGSLLLFCAQPYRVSRACRRVLGEKREAGVQGETQEQPRTPRAGCLPLNTGTGDLALLAKGSVTFQGMKASGGRSCWASGFGEAQEGQTHRGKAETLGGQSG